MKKYLKKLPGGIKFLLIMILIYTVSFWVNSALIKNSLLATTKSFINLLPMLIFVFVVIFIINLLLKPEIIKRHLGHDSGAKGWVYASLGSVFVSSPPYILFPMLKELRQHGMKYSLAALFLNNRNVQPAYLPVMVYYFGLPLTIIVSVYIILFAFINALIIGRVLDGAIS